MQNSNPSSLDKSTIEPQQPIETTSAPIMPNHMLAAVFFKCQTRDWAFFDKGKIYHKNVIGKYLFEFPNDFKPVLEYPTSKDLIECIVNGKNKSKILKALKQWSSVK